MNPKLTKYDVVVIGAGVAGCCIARELSRYNATIAVLEAGLDIADVTTRANSGIVHAGYDPKPGTNKAKYNVWGAKVYPQWAEELGFQYKQNGALIVAFDEQNIQTVQDLYKRGEKNGVADLQILSGDEARKIEPNLSIDIIGALYVPTSGICDPYQVAYRAAENAINNGAEFVLDCAADKIKKQNDSTFLITTKSGQQLFASAIVNAAGLNSDEINNQVSSRKLQITPKRGEYCLFDTQYGKYFSNTIFQCPTKAGKGVLVSPTVHGNLFIGPSAQEQHDKDDYSTSTEGLNDIQTQAAKTWPDLNMQGLITNFSGVRAAGNTGDFVIGEPDDVPGFFNIALLESPGLTSAPAIAEDLSKQIADKLNLSERAGFNPLNNVEKRYFEMTQTEREKSVEQNPQQGHVICRCRQVTEKEVVDALKSPVPLITIDAIKWRTGATMGRCHGGFCTPELIKYLCVKHDIEPYKVEKRSKNSFMFSKNREDYIIRARDDIALEPEYLGEDMSKFVNADTVFDVLVIGGGAAGIAATISALQNNAKKVCLIDRENRLGGILKQCIHSGFGLHHFNVELTGPEYATREIDTLMDLAEATKQNKVTVLTRTMVTNLQKCQGADSPKNAKFIVSATSQHGYNTYFAKSVVMASGSRERGFGSLNVAGCRPSGIYTAGSAQNFINLQGVIPGREAVILGSGDIGLIMARRMVLSGMKVKAVYEIMPNPSGLKRNISQCLDDFGIPLYLSHTVVAVHGKSRLESVTIQQVDNDLKPIPGTQQEVACDTLVLSVGLIPESELAIDAGAKPEPKTKSVSVGDDFQTSIPGLFVCGNALHIHDLVDYASAEGRAAGANAA